ncbi:MAG: hypothetical protein RLZZ396_885, partial [Planctomycetota bacterium]
MFELRLLSAQLLMLLLLALRKKHCQLRIVEVNLDAHIPQLLRLIGLGLRGLELIEILLRFGNRLDRFVD